MDHVQGRSHEPGTDQRSGRNHRPVDVGLGEADGPGADGQGGGGRDLRLESDQVTDHVHNGRGRVGARQQLGLPARPPDVVVRRSCDC